MPGPATTSTVIIDFIRLQKPPASPFSARRPAGDPFHVEEADVEPSEAIYKARCAECHEPGWPRFRTVIPASELGTDRHRIDMWTAAARDRYTNYEEGYRWGFRAFHKTNGYLTNELTGLWLRGPYLHNGSVPTLRDLMAPPEARPKRFYRGYDLVDPAVAASSASRAHPASVTASSTTPQCPAMAMAAISTAPPCPTPTSSACWPI